MTPMEALRICQLAKTLSPAQAVDEFTPDAWALVLRSTRYADAEEALAQLGAEQEWIHVSHIVARVKRIRRDRALAFGPLPDPPREIDPADPAAYQRWLRETTTAIADGTYQAPERQAIGQRRDVVRELGHVGQSVDVALAVRPAREAHAEAKRELQAAAAEERRRLEERRAERARRTTPHDLARREDTDTEPEESTDE